MAAIRNTNKRRAAGPYNLPAEIVGEEACSRAQMQTTEHDKATGDVGVRMFEKVISPSVWFQPGETKEVPDSYLDCPEVREAVRLGELAIVGAVSQ